MSFHVGRLQSVQGYCWVAGLLMTAVGYCYKLHITQQSLHCFVFVVQMSHFCHYFTCGRAAKYCDDVPVCVRLSTNISLELHVRSSPFFTRYLCP